MVFTASLKCYKVKSLKNFKQVYNKFGNLQLGFQIFETLANSREMIEKNISITNKTDYTTSLPKP